MRVKGRSLKSSAWLVGCRRLWGARPPGPNSEVSVMAMRHNPPQEHVMPTSASIMQAASSTSSPRSSSPASASDVAVLVRVDGSSSPAPLSRSRLVIEGAEYAPVAVGDGGRLAVRRAGAWEVWKSTDRQFYFVRDEEYIFLPDTDGQVAA